jgi:hypothetical protein
MPTPECLDAQITAEKEARIASEARHVAEISEAFTRIRALEAALNLAKGANFALAKIGAGVVFVLSGVGWLSLHGIPQWIKESFWR